MIFHFSLWKEPSTYSLSLSLSPSSTYFRFPFALVSPRGRALFTRGRVFFAPPPHRRRRGSFHRPRCSPSLSLSSLQMATRRRRDRRLATERESYSGRCHCYINELDCSRNCLYVCGRRVRKGKTDLFIFNWPARMCSVYTVFSSIHFRFNPPSRRLNICVDNCCFHLLFSGVAAADVYTRDTHTHTSMQRLLNDSDYCTRACTFVTRI